MIRKKIVQCPAPSILAASSSSFGIVRKNWRSRKTPNAPDSAGTMSAAWDGWLYHPSSRTSANFGT
jgi:hypothetical protein